VIERTVTQSELLSMWERGDGQRPSRRALALLSALEADAEELASLPVGRRDAALLSLREQLFGSAFTGVTSCPACGEEIEIAFDASEVRREGGVDASTLRIVEGDFAFEVRLPNSLDLEAVEGLDDVGVARERLLARCAGDVVLAPELVELVAARMAESDPQADVAIDVACPSCAHGWREPFDIVTFLWTEVAVFAKRLLGDVHELARAYGWSEGEILALSPARRAAYLELVR
jgi:hypothetical protein